MSLTVNKYHHPSLFAQQTAEFNELKKVLWPLSETIRGNEGKFCSCSSSANNSGSGSTSHQHTFCNSPTWDEDAWPIGDKLSKLMNEGI